jgi:hypothetical protein
MQLTCLTLTHGGAKKVTGGQLIALKATGQTTKKHKPTQLTVEVCKQILGTIAYTDSSDYKEAQPSTYKQSLNTAKDSTQFALVASTGATTQQGTFYS